MAIDIDDPTLAPLAVIARDIPNRRGGRGVNAATVWRWATHGVKGDKLETIVCGGIRYTTPAARNEFLRKITARANGDPRPAVSDRRQKAIEAAERELAKFGI